MKKYKYIRLEDIENYDDWVLYQAIDKNYCDMAVIMKEDKPIQNYIKLNEATNEQLIEELFKRLNKGDV